MSSFDDSKLTNIKLDDTHDASPISASPRIEDSFLNDKISSFGENQQPDSSHSNSTSNQDNNLAEVNNENYVRLFSSLFLDQINCEDVNSILESQKQIINRLDFTNKNLINANKSSSETFNSFGVKDYQSYIVLLNSMKQDLELIFKRIRLMKNKLQLKHPAEYENALKKVQQNRKFEESDEDEESLIEDKLSAQRKISVIKEEEQNKCENKDCETEMNPRQFQNSPSFKERSISNASAASSASSTSAMMVNLIQTAKNRISTSGKDIVNGFFNSTTTVTSIPTNGQVPAPVLSNYLSSKLESESLSKKLEKAENSQEISNEN